MTKRKIINVHVVPFLRGLQWHIKVNGRRVSRFSTQADAEACAIYLARLFPSASVRAHKGDGEFKWERTYPRAAESKKPG
jgi:hypothetical protein